MSDDDLRRYALDSKRQHDPALQAEQSDDAWPDRCALCHYTRHPCDVFELATIVLDLLERDRPDVEGPT